MKMTYQYEECPNGCGIDFNYKLPIMVNSYDFLGEIYHMQGIRDEFTIGQWHLKLKPQTNDN